MSIITPMSQRLTRTQWLICIMAAIGFAFDIYEILMLPLIVAPALAALVKATPGTDAYNYWIGVLLWVPAIAGGIFGLLGGYLTDRLGRRRVLTWSILIYAVSAFAAGYSTNIWMFLFFRCTTFIGVCVEFVAAVAWLAEIFTEPKQRECVDPHARHVTARDLRPARVVAVHADVRIDSGAAADHHPAVPARVTRVA